jgi:methylenetetrahydrofolate dehydrogenase (NADP+)/methenyltetrahydrofolate cyclohydrolase
MTKIKSKTTVFDGRREANRLITQLKTQSAEIKNPGKLGIVLVGENAGSRIYVNRKLEAAAQIGIKTKLVQLDKFSEPKIKKLLINWAQNEEIAGIMVQLPLPSATLSKTKTLLDLIPPNKDVDGLTSHNLTLINQGRQAFLPATVMAVEHILHQADAFDKWNDRPWAVVGAKGMVGQPLVARLRFLGIKILPLDEGDDLAVLKQAKVVITATGISGLISPETIESGAIVIDVGFPSPDVQFDDLKNKVDFITPVPGGVGPVTVAMLLKNTVQAINETRNKMV